MSERTCLSRVHRDLRRELGIGNEGRHRPLGEVEALGHRWHRRYHVVRGQIQERSGHEGSLARSPAPPDPPLNVSRAAPGYHASAMSESSALRARLIAEGLEPGAWSNGPGDQYGSHDHAYDKVIVVAAGTIRFGLASGPVELGEGDRLELVAGTAHDARVGPDGVTCLEAHLPHGSLHGTNRHAAGTW
jgi:mannose-6-phosphate isomerase-like protein (cupin superfamily)